MDSIDKLREYARKLNDSAAMKSERGITPIGIRKNLESIANEIERDYTSWPVDKDGESIRLGDTVFNDIWQDGRRVYEIGFTDGFGVRIYDDKAEWALAGVCTHYRKPTVEDVLREMIENIDAYDANFIDAYAEKLKELMSDGE